MAIPGGMMDRVIKARQQAPGYNPNILGAFGQFMTGVGNLIQGRPYMSGPRVGQPGQYYGPAYASAEALGIKPGGLRDYDSGYKEKELAAGADAERSRPGAGFPGQQGMVTLAAPGPGTTPPAVIDPYAAQNRAYQQERARVEAMVKANPDMQKQEIADERAKVRDQGMAIWAAKYGGQGGLAERVKPGQVGYDAIQGALAVPTLDQMPEGIPTQGPTPNIPQIDPTLNPAGPNYLGGEGPPLMNFADPRFENMSPEEFQKLLNQVNRK